MAELIAAGTAQAYSGDIVLASGASATFALKGLSGELQRGTVARIQIKAASGGTYITIGQIDDVNPVKVLTAAGTFRVSKEATTLAVGVDQT